MSRWGKAFFTPPERPDKLWGPDSFQFNGHWELFAREESVRGLKVSTYLHLVLRLRMNGAIPLLHPLRLRTVDRDSFACDTKFWTVEQDKKAWWLLTRLFQQKEKNPIARNSTRNVRKNVTLGRVRVTFVTVNIKYSEYVFVALVIQHAMRMRRIILSSGLSGCTTFPYIISWTARFLGKSWVLIFSTAFVRNISHPKRNSARCYHKCALVFM
jgi:hypothetical protein